MANGGGEGIRFREETFPTFEILEAQALDICGKEEELAKAVVGVSVEAANQRPVSKFLGATSKRAACQRDPKFAANVVSAPNLRPKSIEQSFHGC